MINVKMVFVFIRNVFLYVCQRSRITVSYGIKVNDFQLSTDISNFRVDSDVVESAVIAVIHCCTTYFIFHYR